MARPLSGLEKLTPVESVSLNERAYRQLREAIMAGSFRPGEVLTLRGLAAALGTSIMPARDAVLRLSAERALEPIGRGVRVPVHTLEDLQDVLRIRLALEGEAAALAAERATAVEISAIIQAASKVEKIKQQKVAPKFVAANEEFHFTVYRAAHNDLLQSMIETLWLQIGPHLAMLAEAGQGMELEAIDLSAHDELVDAIQKRDPTRARRALCADLMDSTDVFKPFMAEPLAETPVTAKRRKSA